MASTHTKKGGGYLEFSTSTNFASGTRNGRFTYDAAGTLLFEGQTDGDKVVLDGIASGTTPDSVVTKAQLETALLTGHKTKESVRAASIAAITDDGDVAIDLFAGTIVVTATYAINALLGSETGLAVANIEDPEYQEFTRYLFKDGSGNNKVNGIYYLSAVISTTSYTLTRAIDFNVGTEVRPNTTVYVEKGGTNAGKTFGISADFDRYLQVGGTVVTTSGSAGDGVSSALTLSASVVAPTTSNVYVTDPLAVHAGTAVQIGNYWYAVASGTTVSTDLSLVAPGLLETVPAGTPVRVGTSILAASGDTTDVTNGRIDAAGLVWTEVYSGGNTYLGGDNITLNTLTFDLDAALTGMTSVATTGDADLTLNAGTGNVVVGGGAATGTIASSGNYNLVLETGNATTGNITIIDDANSNIEITPHGTGRVVVGGTTSTITGKSGSDFIVQDWSANSAMTIIQASGNIKLAATGSSGDIRLDADATNGTVVVVNGEITTASNADLVLNAGTGNIAVGNGAADDPGVLESNGNNDLVLQTGNSTTSSITITDGTDGAITLNTNGSGGEVVIGNGTNPGKITSNGAASLILDANAGTGGQINMNSGTNANIEVTPNGTGDVVIGGSAPTITTIAGVALIISTADTNKDITLAPHGTGNVVVSSDQITLGDATGATITTFTGQALTLATVDSNANVVLNPHGTGTIACSSARITGAGDPTGAQDVVTKLYSDQNRAKPSVRVATTAALADTGGGSWIYSSGSGTLTAAGVGVHAAVDGITLLVNDLVLIQDGFTTAVTTGVGTSDQGCQGVYEVTTLGAGGATHIYTRVDHMDATADFGGAVVYVEEGTTNGGNSFICDVTPNAVTDPFVLNSGTAAAAVIAFSAFGAGGTTYTASSGVTLAGDDIQLELNSLVDKGTPVAADSVGLIDSEVGNTDKKATITNLTTTMAGIMAGTVTSTGLSDSTGVISLDIANMTGESAIVAADEFAFNDSGTGLRKITLDQLATKLAGTSVTNTSGVLNVRNRAKPSVRVATTAALADTGGGSWIYSSGAGTLTAAGVGVHATVDSITLLVNDLVLIQDGFSTAVTSGVGTSDQGCQGVYEVTTLGAGGATHIYTRVDHMDATADFGGAVVYVEEGTTNGGNSFICDVTPNAVTNPFVLNSGTAAAAVIAFSAFGAAGSLTLDGFSVAAKVGTGSGSAASLALTTNQIIGRAAGDIAAISVTQGTVVGHTFTGDLVATAAPEVTSIAVANAADALRKITIQSDNASSVAGIVKLSVGTDNFSGTLTFTGDAKTVTIADDLTVTNAMVFGTTNGGTLDFGAASKTLTVTESMTLTSDTAGKTLTLNDSLTVDGGNDGTLSFGGASKTLTVNDSLTIGGGNTGIFNFTAASKTLAVSETCTIDQNLATTQDVVFLSVVTTSEPRFKDDMQTVTGALSTIKQLNGIEWKWNDNLPNKQFVNKKSAGVNAAELKQIIPCAVKGEAGNLGVNYSCLHAFEIEAIKELADTSDQLVTVTDRIKEDMQDSHAALRDEVAELRKQVATLLAPNVEVEVEIEVEETPTRRYNLRSRNK